MVVKKTRLSGFWRRCPPSRSSRRHAAARDLEGRAVQCLSLLPRPPAQCATINMAVNPWVSYEAKAPMSPVRSPRPKLGCTVNYKGTQGGRLRRGFAPARFDVVIEDLGHPDLGEVLHG